MRRDSVITSLVWSGMVIAAALLACKEDKPEATVSATASAPATAAPEATASAAPQAADEVKRYGADEREERGTVRVLLSMVKVFAEADATKPHIATLSTGTLVNRKARYGEYLLVEYPSGPAKLSPGWIHDKGGPVSDIVVVNVDAGVVDPAVSASAVVSAVPSASAAPVSTRTGRPKGL